MANPSQPAESTESMRWWTKLWRASKPFLRNPHFWWLFGEGLLWGVMMSLSAEFAVIGLAGRLDLSKTPVVEGADSAFRQWLNGLDARDWVIIGLCVGYVALSVYSAVRIIGAETRAKLNGNQAPQPFAPPVEASAERIESVRSLLRDAIAAGRQIRERSDLCNGMFQRWQRKTSVLGHLALHGARADELDTALETASTGYQLKDRVHQVVESLRSVLVQLSPKDIRASYDPSKIQWSTVTIGPEEQEPDEVPSDRRVSVNRPMCEMHDVESKKRIGLSFVGYNANSHAVRLEARSMRLLYGDRVVSSVSVEGIGKEVPAFAEFHFTVTISLAGSVGDDIRSDVTSGALKTIDARELNIAVVGPNSSGRLRLPDGAIIRKRDDWTTGIPAFMRGTTA